MQKNKVLLRIRNLKQYFPLKKKGLYVKANDDISIDIYEGETFGLVGESGCGKSTLGRTLLQLYPQTDGRTMYYGRTLYEIAPLYVKKTIQTLEKRRESLKELERKRDQVQQQYDGLDERAQYDLKPELDKAKKEANDAFLDIANLIGGLLVAKDLKPVIGVYHKIYECSCKLKAANEKHAMCELARDDAKYALDEAKKAGQPTAAIEARLARREAAYQASSADVAAAHATLNEAIGKADALRKPYEQDAEFQRLEQYRDDGVDLARLTYNEMRTLRSDLQLIFQDPYSSLNPRMSVGQIIGEGLLAHKFFRKNDGRMKAEVIKTMESCGLAPYFLHRFPHQFSGGQRQRIGIARSLAVRPKLVVCDEAVSALDVSIQSQIINLLQDLKEKQNLTYLFITHDLSVVKYISDRIGVMYLGNMVELSSSQDIFTEPLHPYTEALLSSIPTTDEDASRELVILEGDIPSPVNPPKGCKFHTRCKYCTEVCENVIPEWRELRPNHFVACHHPLGGHDE